MMDNIAVKGSILAVVTEDREMAASGVPVFYAKDQQEKDRIALFLSKILAAMVHDIGNGCYILVRH
jgi:metal-dependent HD superfamily phosphatase/phosphodiesterase